LVSHSEVATQNGSVLEQLTGANTWTQKTLNIRRMKENDMLMSFTIYTSHLILLGSLNKDRLDGYHM